jgi:hypothetical protein
MVQPVNYAQLAGGFQAPQEAFLNTIKLREAYLQQQQAREEARNMQADLAAYTSAPTPQKLADLHLKYPALKESLNAYTQTLSDADKRTTTEFATQAFGLNRAGKTEDVLSLFDRYITGAETSGRTDIARVMRDAKDTYSKIEDQNAREGLIGSVLAGTGKDGLDLYDKIWNASGSNELTAFQRNLVAANIDPNSERGRQMAEQFAVNQADPLVELETPSGGKFVGPRSEYFRIYGADAPKPNVVPSPKSQAEYEALAPGTQYRAPDGSLKVKGGQTGSKPSGNFRGQ